MDLWITRFIGLKLIIRLFSSVAKPASAAA